MTAGYYSPKTFESLHFAEPLPPDVERQLLAEWQHLGCLKSRDTLVERFALYASTLAHRFCGPRSCNTDEDMQDVVSIANAALMKAADQFDLRRPKARFASLLYLLVRRDVVNWVRGEIARPDEREFNGGEVRASGSRQPADEVVEFAFPREPGDQQEADEDLAADAETVLQALPLLPDKEQELLRKVFFEDQSFLAAAREMGLSRWEVGELKKSAYSSLRAALAQ